MASPPPLGGVRGGAQDVVALSTPELQSAWNQAMLKLFGVGNTYPSFDEIMNSGRGLTESIAGEFTKAMSKGMGKLEQQIDPAFRARLDNDVWVFSGCKTYNELKEASRLLKDSNGALKPFGQFVNDVHAINEKYNRAWLKSEYEHAVGSSRMAAKWQQYEDPDFNLQYRTAGDEKVREEHAALNDITLPPDDPFWNEYYPPNGWRCRCNTVQVIPDKYPQSDSKDAIAKGDKATTYIDKNGRNRSAMFRFNPGKEGALFPEHHPYYSSAPRRKVENWLNENKVGSGKSAVGSEFVPAKNMAEFEQRIKNLGVKTTDIKYNNLDDLNMFLKTFEENYKSVDVDRLIINSNKFGNTGGHFLVDGNFGTKELYYNLGKIDTKPPKITSYQNKINLLKNRINELNKNIKQYEAQLGKTKSRDLAYKKDIKAAKSQITSREIRINELNKKIQNGEESLIFSVPERFENRIDRLNAVIHHEMGHYHDNLLGLRKNVSFNEKLAASEYGKYSIGEYVAEHYADYKMKTGNVPKELKDLFIKNKL